MKKLFLSFLLFTSSLLQAQYPLSDALKLRNATMPDPNGTTKIYMDLDSLNAFSVLVSYDPELSKMGTVTFVQLKNKYRDNPFLSSNLEGNAPILFDKPTKSGQGKAAGGANPFAFASGINVTNLADGLAKFLVKRSKEELNTAFFKKFKEKFDEFPVLQILLPSTRSSFEVIGNEIYRINAYTQTLREAFVADLKDLPGNFGILIEKEEFIKDPETRFLASEVFQAAQMMLDETPLPELIAHFDDGRFDPAMFPELHSAFRYLHLFSEIFRAGEGELPWISPDKAAPLWSELNAKTLNITLGLLYQRYRDLPVGDKTVGQMLMGVRPQLEYFKRLLRQFALLTGRATADVSKQRRMAKENIEAATEDQASAVANMRMVLEFADSTQGFFQPKMKKASRWTRTMTILQLASNLQLQVRQKKYASAIITAVVITDSLLTKVDLKPVLLKYGTFMATVAAAQNSDEIAAAIEAVALPPGSSSIKKYSSFSVSLNTFVGGFYGYEHLQGTEFDFDKNQITGITAPLGFALNWGMNGWKRKGVPTRQSLSVFVTAIDVGALTSFRFKDEAAQDLPEVNLSNILAPGGHLVWGLPGLPISIGAGAQYGPFMREVGGESVNAWRASVFMGVDIPLVHFSAKERRN